MKKFAVALTVVYLAVFATVVFANECTQDKDKKCCKAGKTCNMDKEKCATRKECAKAAKVSKDPTEQEVVLDPVCGMDIKASEAKYSCKYQDKTYRFCSDSCMKNFKKAPSKYIGKDSQKGTK